MCEVMEKYMAEARNEANIIAIVNMLDFDIDEASIRERYPNEFEEGKKRFLKKKK